jgi:NADPH:quinone reductase-like Zn-dependent oxidoreductase
MKQVRQHASMKAVVYTHYGGPDVLQLKDVEKPQPRDDEVLISVHAASVNAADAYLLKGKPLFLRLEYGLLRPKKQILGADIAGRVEAIGRNVKTLQPGDEVFGDLSGCGWGGLAEYVAVPGAAVTAKPAGATFEEAASVPMAAVTALQGLRDKGRIQAGQKVLIHGASGGVGTFAVQLAKAFGAEVTAVCSASKMDLMHMLGADRIIDYTREDFSRNGQRYDLILVTNGSRSPFDYRRALKPNGACVVTGGAMRQIFQTMFLGPALSRAGNKRLVTLLARPNRQDLNVMKDLIEAGKITPVIDRRYPLAEAPEALRYLGAGHARGKVVITVKGHDSIRGGKA